METARGIDRLSLRRGHRGRDRARRQADRRHGVARYIDQRLGEIREDPPIAILVRVSQGRARNGSPEAHVVELSSHRMETWFNVAEAFSVSQLSECHHQKLVPARETLQVPLPAVASDTSLKLLMRGVRHQLGEYGAADVHGPLSIVAR